MLSLFSIVLAMSVPSTQAAPKLEMVDGVPFQCVNDIRHALIRKFARETPGDRDSVEEYRDDIRSAPSLGCRPRSNMAEEQITWCNGGACSGAIGERINGKCVVRKLWSGQDDQDEIDVVEWRRVCLVAADYQD